MGDGIDLAISSMSLGEIAQITVKSLEVSDPSKLFYQIELLDIIQMSDDELYSLAKTLKEKGNREFLAKNLEKAQGMYWNGIDFVEQMTRFSKDVCSLAVEIYNHFALVSIQLKKFEQTIMATDCAIQLDKKSVKAHFRKS
mgnify:CR=1 FL=1